MLEFVGGDAEGPGDLCLILLRSLLVMAGKEGSTMLELETGWSESELAVILFLTSSILFSWSKSL